MSDWARYLLDARIAAAASDGGPIEVRSPTAQSLVNRVHLTICCSQCGAERRETLAWFVGHSRFTCTACRAVISLDDRPMREAKDALTMLGAACEFLDQRYRRSA